MPYVHGIGLLFPLSVITHQTPGRYDFDLKTGKSETGLRACTYSVEIKNDPEDGLEKVFMEPPVGGSNWRLVELRPVSEGISYLLSLKVLAY